MISAGYTRVAISSIPLLLGVCVVSILGGRDPSSGSLILAADTNRGVLSTTGSQDRGMDAIRGLTIDLAEYNICPRLKGRILPLSSGSSSGGGKKSTMGIVRIDTCSIQRTDPKHLRIDISGPGWQWISRKKERYGAKFTVDDNIKFLVSISMVGTFDMNYDQGKHILTIWFVPTQPVDAGLKVRGNVDVDYETLWSSIVGATGTLLGASPEERAKETVRSQGSQKFRFKLSQGMTFILDMCSGRQSFRLGTFPAGEIPDNTTPTGGKPYLVNSRGVLHNNSLLMAGPYKPDKPIAAHVEVLEGGGVNAVLVCEDEARKIADAYVDGRAIPRFEALDEQSAQVGKPASLKAKLDLGCNVVMVMRPSNEQRVPITFTYTMLYRGAEPKPLVKCDR